VKARAVVLEHKSRHEFISGIPMSPVDSMGWEILLEFRGNGTDHRSSLVKVGGSENTTFSQAYKPIRSTYAVGRKKRYLRKVIQFKTYLFYRSFPS